MLSIVHFDDYGNKPWYTIRCYESAEMRPKTSILFHVALDGDWMMKFAAGVYLPGVVTELYDYRAIRHI